MLVVWLGGAVALGLFSSTDAISLFAPSAASHDSGPIHSADRQLQQCQFLYRNPQHQYRPVFSIGFDLFHAENGQLGLLQTPLHKVVTIDNLRLRFFQYGDTNGPEGSTLPLSLPEFFPPDTLAAPPEAMAATPDATIGRLAARLFGNQRRFGLPDVSNTSAIRIRDFDCRFFDRGDLILAVQCRRAEFTHRSAKTLLLRGHVTITAADGSTVQSNHIEWNVDRQSFTVDRKYLLTRDGVRTAGRGICLDARLHPVLLRPARTIPGDQKCLAKN